MKCFHISLTCVMKEKVLSQAASTFKNISCNHKILYIVYFIFYILARLKVLSSYFKVIMYTFLLFWKAIIKTNMKNQDKQIYHFNLIFLLC